VAPAHAVVRLANVASRSTKRRCSPNAPDRGCVGDSETMVRQNHPARVWSYIHRCRDVAV